MRDELESAIVAMQESRLGFDALVQPRHLAVLAEFAERYPQLQSCISGPNKVDELFAIYSGTTQRFYRIGM